MKEEIKIYAVADFANYHAGTMPAGEMHALEKAALEDPFLSDALEGYLNTTTPGDDIAGLSERLREKNKSRKVFFLSPATNKAWWRAAAALIIISGTGYLFYNVKNQVKETTLAKNEIKNPAEKEQPVSTDSQIETNINPQKTSAAQKPSEKIDSKLAAIDPKIKEVEVSSNGSAPVVASAAETKTDDGYNADKALATEAQKDTETKLIKKYVFKGSVRDEKGEPVAFAKVEDKKNKTGTLTDTAGRFSLRSQDSTITALASANGYESKHFLLNQDKPATIEINKQQPELDEVVVTGVGRQKKDAAPASKALSGKVSGVRIAVNSPVPLIGKTRYDDYLQKNKFPVVDSAGKIVTGEVLLSFSIDKKGLAKNIFVTRSSCTACEAEAIRLLKDGPAWDGKKGDKGILLVKF